MKQIRITTEDKILTAKLNDSPTADAIYDSLPLTGQAHVWGKEIYFMAPLHIELADDARRELEEGELAFWSAGDAFCIFFGTTPLSTGTKPMAYSPVNVFGKIEGDLSLLSDVRDGDSIEISVFNE